MVVLLCLGLFGVFPSQINALLNGSNFVTEVTGLPFTPRVVDVDSSGRIFVGDTTDDVWRSVDQGSTWTKVLDGPSGNFVQIVFVNSRDYVFAQVWKWRYIFRLYRSIDHGTTWNLVADDMKRVGLGKWGESSNGTLYMATWGEAASGYKDAIVYASVDLGASWFVWYNITGTVTHTHAVNVAPNDWVYLSTGDKVSPNQTIRRWKPTTGWEIVVNGEQPTSIWFDDTYVYFGPDYAPNNLYRMHYNGNWSQAEVVWKSTVFGSDNWVFEGVRIGDIMLFGTERGQLWGSWDGEHWAKIWDTPTVDSIFSISEKRPIYFIDRTAKKLYRLNIQKEDLIQLFYTQFNQKRGSLSNAENYVLEQRIHNGTNYLDLTSVALSNVQVSIKGLSRYNYAKSGNSGFEWGNKTGWTELSPPLGSITSASGQVANGTYAYKIVKSASNVYYSSLQSLTTIARRGNVIIVSAYYKGNTTMPAGLSLGIYNATSGGYFNSAFKSFNVTTSWQKAVVTYALYETSTTATETPIFIKFVFWQKDLTTYIDSVLFQVLEVGIEYFDSTSVDSTVYSEKRKPFTYFDEILNTLDPSLTIKGQSVSYSGTLTNGTASTPQSLSENFTGTVKVDANIQGSGQAILRLTGTRILYEDSIILRGWKDNIYYGRYYGTFYPTTITTDLIAVTNLASNITSLSYTFSNLTLTIDSPPQTTSTTLIYVSDKGEPKDIIGATSWSYNNSSKILTVTATHSSWVTITIEWEIPGGTIPGTIPGDINRDNIVNATDLSLFSEAYGLTPTNPNADINHDGYVDVRDLAILGKNYGKTS